jgi:hypothetical protein
MRAIMPAKVGHAALQVALVSSLAGNCTKAEFSPHSIKALHLVVVPKLKVESLSRYIGESTATSIEVRRPLVADLVKIASNRGILPRWPLEIVRETAGRVRSSDLGRILPGSAD